MCPCVRVVRVCVRGPAPRRQVRAPRAGGGAAGGGAAAGGGGALLPAGDACVLVRVCAPLTSVSLGSLGGGWIQLLPAPAGIVDPSAAGSR